MLVMSEHIMWSNYTSLGVSRLYFCVHRPIYMSAKLGQITENNVSMELGEHTDSFLAENMTKAHKGVLMHAIFLCA